VARVYSSLTLFVFTGDYLSHFTDAHELTRLYHFNLPALTPNFHSLTQRLSTFYILRHCQKKKNLRHTTVKNNGHKFSLYMDAGKSLARPTSRCILFDCENISFDASLVIYINSTNIPPIMIVNRIYKTQNLLACFLPGRAKYLPAPLYSYTYILV
jgi:hypothetical protein